MTAAEPDDTQRLLSVFVDWLAAGRTYAEFRETHPEFSEWDICAAIHSLPTPVEFPRPRTAHSTVGAPALFERLAVLYAAFRDPASENRLVAERMLVDEWAADLFSYCRQKPQAGLRFLAMLREAEVRTAFDLTKEGHTVSLVVWARLSYWRRLAVRMLASQA